MWLKYQTSPCGTLRQPLWAPKHLHWHESMLNNHPPALRHTHTKNGSGVQFQLLCQPVIAYLFNFTAAQRGHSLWEMTSLTHYFEWQPTNNGALDVCMQILREIRRAYILSTANSCSKCDSPCSEGREQSPRQAGSYCLKSYKDTVEREEGCNLGTISKIHAFHCGSGFLSRYCGIVVWCKTSNETCPQSSHVNIN